MDGNRVEILKDKRDTFPDAITCLEADVSLRDDRIKQLEQANAQLREALEKQDHELDRIQWVRGADKFEHLAESRSCPSCGFREAQGHPAGCSLASVRAFAAKALGREA